MSVGRQTAGGGEQYSLLVMKQFPEIETERLWLTELLASDIPEIVQYAGNQKISDTTGNIPFPYAEKDAISWVNLAHQGFNHGTHAIFGIRRKPENEFIGGIGLTIETKFNRAEIGYWVAEPFWNKGYATEATQAVIKFGFEELGLNKLTSSHLAKNSASGRVMIKNGMVQEGRLDEHVLKHNTYHTLVLYGLTKKQYDNHWRVAVGSQQDVGSDG